ncbi:uncharacterized protein LOC117315161 [Pecten maximus]|uniref:uncharacterized protein LOC117315161 n=1 Tax=Pecten maximus TaxID=6579 RepID=UPI0014587017|nr:uncharacterized protein LOC117315161 [Pecten maximus]
MCFPPARVVLDSLNLLNEESVVNPPTPIKLLHLVSPRRSPRLTALRDIENENESLKARVSILENQVSTLQFHQNNLWSEYEKLSYTVATLRQQSWMSQPQLTPTTSNVHPVVPTHTVHETSADEKLDCTPATKENLQEVTHCGYTKKQLAEIARGMREQKKASAKLFRLLYTKQEMEGRSLTGRGTAGKQARPALADLHKLEIIYEIMQNEFGAGKEQINIVLRDLLKPSRKIKA